MHAELRWFVFPFYSVARRNRVIAAVRISVVPVPSVPLVQELQKMVRHKIVHTVVVAASLVAMVIGSMPRAFLFADEFPPPSGIGSVASPQWDLTTLTVYDSNDASINVTVDSAGSPVITASVDQDASSGTFAFSMVSDDGFESLLVSGEVLADGSISCQTVNANLAGATSSAGGAAAWAAADSEPGFWDDYWRYLWNPSDMDPELEVGFYVSAGVGVTAGTVATGGIIYYGPAAALPTVFGGGAAATGTAVAGGGVAATSGTLGIGTQAVVVGELGAGTYPALIVDGTVYVARFHNVAWQAANYGTETKYGMAIIDAAGKVIGWL